MSAYNPLDATHQAFVDWATSSQGVIINGIQAARIPGRGHGIISSRRIKKDERLVFVPSKALITINSEFVKSLKLPNQCTVHGRLAAALMLVHSDDSRSYLPWEQTWPTMEELMQSIPLQWSRNHVDLLSQSAKALREKQTSKLTKDRDALRHIVPPELLDSDLYVYFWLVVNTRCFFWDYPPPGRKRFKRRKTQNVDDCMALCPFADYFNHAEDGCDFDSNPSGCWITADRDYDAGDELFVSYGKHSNDFLLVEYGFVLPQNKWDTIKLDDYILPKLTASQKDVLQEFSLFGDYTLDSSQICYRSQATLLGLVLPKAKWRRFLNGEYDSEHEQPAMDKKCLTILLQYQDDIGKNLRAIEQLQKCPEKDALAERWKQIETMVHNTVQRLR
ncbi:SET domain-containing protein [Rhizodiscina lignyota]|uniref:SET domain-containing protein n=1 Tax=Rhizodiscina lignyota TaxID=1504668 RepID=A0A9P4M4M7_9PEZI|nr:SET domain-containing protein [Rhizodiscina lignyota]